MRKVVMRSLDFDVLPGPGVSKILTQEDVEALHCLSVTNTDTG